MTTMEKSFLHNVYVYFTFFVTTVFVFGECQIEISIIGDAVSKTERM